MVRRYEKVQVEEERLLGVICDVCKKPQDLSSGKCYQSIKVEAGYDSVLGDGKIYELDICDSCFKKILAPHCTVTLQPCAAAMLELTGRPLASYSESQLNAINCPEEVLTLAIKVFGSKQLAEHWLTSPRKKFGGVSPLEFLKTNESGQSIVSEALIQIDEGYFN